MSKLKGDPGYRAKWCIHYRAASTHETCEADVPFRSFEGRGPRPCFLTDDGKSKPEACACEKLRLPTPEEIAAHNEWLIGRMDLLGKVMESIAPWRKANRGRNARTVMECAACGGKLHLSIAASNGHVWGKCETPDCMDWRE